jgi:peptidoglycan/LPS O-acetylase OafA/YrhL
VARVLPLLTVALLLVVASPAFAAAGHDNGEGLAGETDDKIVTFFGLGVALFFTIFVIVGTLLQQALEKRKEHRKAARLRQRTGW